MQKEFPEATFEIPGGHTLWGLDGPDQISWHAEVCEIGLTLHHFSSSESSAYV